MSAIPDGWVLVPREPTKAMIEEGLKKSRTNPHPWCPAVYRAMLSASPSTTPTQKQEPVAVKAREPSAAYQDAEESLCTCGAAGSGQGHANWCGWLSSEWRRWGEAYDRLAAPSAPQPTETVAVEVDEALAASRTQQVVKVRRFGAGPGLLGLFDASPLSSPHPREEKMGRAAFDVLAERRRQVEVEGWTPEHDDAHADGQLARAAASYAIYASGLPEQHARHFWPWDWQWWKPEPRNVRRMLVKAGALIIAAIERLDRAAALSHDKGG